jgi:hypothetical protein
MASFPLPLASYALPTPVAAATRLLNCYSQPAPDGGKARAIITRAAGITTLSTLDAATNSVGRGGHVMNGVLYVLVNTTLWRVNAAGVGTSVGTIPGTERVRMATNGTVLVIVRPDVGTGYSCDGSSTSQIVDAVFTGFGAADVAFIHRYFVFRRPNSGQFFNSGLNALTFDALDIAEAEQVPDDLLALTVDHEEVLLFGTQSSEIWYDAANDSGSPFSKSPGGVVTLGITGNAAHGQQDNSTFWLANDRTVRRLQGATPTKVSQLGIDAQLHRLGDVEDCYTVSFSQEGHMFIAFIHPFDSRTFVYDCTVQQWHERESLDFGAWRPAAIVECYGRHIVVDSRSGKIGYLDPTAMEEFGDPQRMSWTYQAVYAENKTAVHRRFELVCNTGYGLLTGQGSDPLATLEVSDDGGETFRTLPTKSLGLRGKYQSRVCWEKLGSSKQRVYRVTITDPIPVMTVDTVLDAEGARF